MYTKWRLLCNYKYKSLQQDHKGNAIKIIMSNITAQEKEVGMLHSKDY